MAISEEILTRQQFQALLREFEDMKAELRRQKRKIELLEATIKELKTKK